MSKYDLIIGIDPDVEKSGFCILNTISKTVELRTLCFSELLCSISNLSASCDIKVIVEAGWLNSKSDFRLNGNGRKMITIQEALMATKIAKNVGANHETGKKIVEMVKHYGIECIERTPLALRWGSDHKSKISNPELMQVLDRNGFTYSFKTSNPEQRDATLIALSEFGVM